MELKMSIIYRKRMHLSKNKNNNKKCNLVWPGKAAVPHSTNKGKRNQRLKNKTKKCKK